MLEQIGAAVVVLVCALLLARLGLGIDRRARVDAAVARWARRVWRALLRVARWPASRLRSRRMADEAIRQAMRGASGHDAHDRGRAGAREVTREGNVYRPKAFRPPRKPDEPPKPPTLH